MRSCRECLTEVLKPRTWPCPLWHDPLQWTYENPDPETALTSTEGARMAEMEDEVRRLRMENEFSHTQWIN
jgi:hypothetical protein